MKLSIQMNKAISLFLVFLSALVCFGLTPTVQAVSPPPDGGYPGQNTAEGDHALLRLTSGQNNTAIGFSALSQQYRWRTQHGHRASALLSNINGDFNTATGASRSLPTPRASPTRQPVGTLSNTSATPTRPLVIERSLATTATTTRRPVVMRS